MYCPITFLTKITKNIQRVECRGNNIKWITRKEETKMPGRRLLLLSKEREEEDVKEGVQKVPFHWHPLVVSLHVSYLRNLSQAIAMASTCILACLDQLLMFPCHLALQADGWALPLYPSASMLLNLPVSMISQPHPLQPWLHQLFLLWILASFRTLVQPPLLPQAPAVQQQTTRTIGRESLSDMQQFVYKKLFQDREKITRIKLESH